MKITAETARNVIATLAACDGNPATAAYQCRLTLRSIAPYTDRATAATARVLEWLERHEPDRRAILIEQLETLATATGPLGSSPGSLP